MRFTLGSLATLLVLFLMSLPFIHLHKWDYATEICSDGGGICVDIETWEVSSKMGFSIDDSTEISFQYGGDSIDCSIRRGNIEFSGMCEKGYLTNLIASGEFAHVTVLVPQLGIVGASIEPTITFVVGLSILRAEAAILWFLGTINRIISVILGVLTILGISL